MLLYTYKSIRYLTLFAAWEIIATTFKRVARDDQDPTPWRGSADPPNPPKPTDEAKQESEATAVNHEYESRAVMTIKLMAQREALVSRQIARLNWPDCESCGEKLRALISWMKAKRLVRRQRLTSVGEVLVITAKGADLVGVSRMEAARQEMRIREVCGHWAFCSDVLIELFLESRDVFYTDLDFPKYRGPFRDYHRKEPDLLHLVHDLATWIEVEYSNKSGAALRKLALTTTLLEDDQRMLTPTIKLGGIAFAFEAENKSGQRNVLDEIDKVSREHPTLDWDKIWTRITFLLLDRRENGVASRLRRWHP